MKTKSICPSCKLVLAFDRALYSVVKCPNCEYKGSVADFEESAETEYSGLNRVNKPGKLELIESDATLLQEEKTISLKSGINTLGRMSSDDTNNRLRLPVNDTFISRSHAAIEVITKPGGEVEHRLSDLGSRNGTFYDGYRLEKGDIIRLMPDGVIKVGHTYFKFITE